MSAVELLTSPATEGVDSPVPAPRVAEILADPAEMAVREAVPYFAQRMWYLDGLSEPTDHPFDPVRHEFGEHLIATTEADALWDFDYKLLALRGIYQVYGDTVEHEYRAQVAERLRQHMRFIGQSELETGAAAIAQHWLNRLNASTEGELFVTASAYESSSVVLQAALAALDKLHPHAGQHIIPLNSDSLPPRKLRDRLTRAGVIYLEDWTLSGSQARGTLGSYLNYCGVPSDSLEANLICATDVHIAEGLDGITCKSYYTYPYIGPDGREHAPMITGSHSDTDYGFRDPLGVLYRGARALAKTKRVEPDMPDGYERLPFPLLYSPARYYAPDLARGANRRMLAPAERHLFDAKQAALGEVSGRIIPPLRLLGGGR